MLKEMCKQDAIGVQKARNLGRLASRETLNRSGGREKAAIKWKNKKENKSWAEKWGPFRGLRPSLSATQSGNSQTKLGLRGQLINNHFRFSPTLRLCFSFVPTVLIIVFEFQGLNLKTKKYIAYQNKNY